MDTAPVMAWRVWVSSGGEDVKLVREGPLGDRHRQNMRAASLAAINPDRVGS